MPIDIPRFTLGLNQHGGIPNLLPSLLALSPAVVYDLQQPNTLFSDRSMTPVTPATAGGPVGTVLDVSGNGYHYVSPSNSARPTLGQSGNAKYLSFDGIDDELIGAALVLNATHTFVSPARSINTGGTAGSLFNYGDAVIASPSEVELDAYDASGTGVTGRIRSRYPSLDTFSTGRAYNANQDYVFSQIKAGATDTRHYLDGVVSSFATSTTAFSTVSKVLKTGRHTNAAQFLFGRWYGGAVFQSALSDPNRIIAERWAASKQGRSL